MEQDNISSNFDDQSSNPTTTDDSYSGTGATESQDNYGQNDTSGDDSSVDYKAKFEEAEREKAQLHTRYAASSTEAKRLAEENEKLRPYSQIGAGLLQRINSDPDFKAKFEGLSKAQQQQVINATADADPQGRQSIATPPAAALDPKAQEAIQWANDTKAKENNRRLAVWSQLEGNDSQEIEKYTTVAKDPNTNQPMFDEYGLPVKINPVRSMIGQWQQFFESQGLSFEESAQRAFTQWKVMKDPNAVSSDAQTNGFIAGLETSSLSTFGNSKNVGKRQKQVVFDADQEKIYRQLGLNPDDPTLKQKWSE
jgi:hypothetical protein